MLWIRNNMVTELFFDKEKGTYVIRKGMFKTNCVIENLTEQNLRGIYNKIGKMLKIKGHKMVKPTEKYRRQQVKPL